MVEDMVALMLTLPADQRREFMRRATQFGAGAAVAAVMAQGIVPRVASAAPQAQAQTSPFSVAATDPTVESRMMDYASSVIRQRVV